MTSVPTAIRIAQTVKHIGVLHLELADLLVASSTSSDPTSRSLVLELVRSVLTELGLLSPPPETEPEEDPMPILRRDFAYAHARFAMKQDEVVVETATGFERTAYAVLKAPEPCHDPMLAARPQPMPETPRNTRLVRLQLSLDHQIDPKEVVAVAVPADRDTSYRFDTKAIPVDDRTIDVAVRRVDPDINESIALARVHVLLFRVA
jgi:hypothetical protein